MSLSNFEYEVKNGKYVITNLVNRNLKEVIIPEGVIEIAECAFSDSLIEKVFFPSSLKVISNSAFEFCEYLIEIHFNSNSSLTLIDESAFTNCYKLKKVIFPDGLVEIGYNAFYSCSSLNEVFIPNSVSKMRANVFEECDELKQINLEHSSIPSTFHMYWNENNVKVILNSKTTKQSNEKPKTSFSIENKTKPIVENSKPLEKNKEDNLSDFVTEYTESGLLQIAELKNKDIKHLVIPSSVKCIKYGAFNHYDCKKIEKVTAHKDLEFIGGYAFEYLEIDSISNLSKKVFIADYAFAYCEKLKNIYITNKTMKGAYMGCKNATSIFIEDDTVYLEDSVCTGCSSLEELNIPNSVTRIEDHAFSRCNSLKKIKFSNNLTRIDEYAFYYCTSLKEIILPDSLDWIESFAFENCSNLENVVFGKKTYFIKKCAFRGCDKIRKIIIPASVKFIERFAFTSKNLKEIIIERYAGEPHVMPQYFEKNWYNEEAKPIIKFKTVKK